MITKLITRTFQKGKVSWKKWLFPIVQKRCPWNLGHLFFIFQEGAIALVDSYDIFMFVNKTDTEHTNQNKKNNLALRAQCVRRRIARCWDIRRCWSSVGSWTVSRCGVIRIANFFNHFLGRVFSNYGLFLQLEQICVSSIYLKKIQNLVSWLKTLGANHAYVISLWYL